MEQRNVSAWWFVAGGCLIAATIGVLAAPKGGEAKPRVRRRVFSNAPTAKGAGGELFHPVKATSST